MLKYKSEWEGKTYIEVDRFFPISKTCNVCLHQVDKLALDIRSWQCPNCQRIHERDVNAAVNIRDEGLRILRCGSEALNVAYKRLGKPQATATPESVPAEVYSARECTPRQGVGRIPLASGERVRPSKGTAFTRHHSVKEESPRF